MAEPKIKRRGILLVLSSPSGAGKTTISRALVAEDEQAHNVGLGDDAAAPPGRGRRQALPFRHARYNSTRMVAQGELLEHAIVFGNCYGTPRGPVMKALDSGGDIISDVDWQGTQQLEGECARRISSRSSSCRRALRR